MDYFTVMSNVERITALAKLNESLVNLQNDVFACPTGKARWSSHANRYIIPLKASAIQEVSALRIKVLLKYLVETNLGHTTIRDVWYGITTAKYGLYDPDLCLKCNSRNSEKFKRDTGRKKRKSGEPVYEKKRRCSDCEFEWTDFENPYTTLGDDIQRIERLTGIEKESLGIHSGQKGFIYGSNRMQAYSPAREFLQFNARPSIMYDLPTLNQLSGFTKIILLEKESFVSHIVPIKNDKPDFRFINSIDTAIITSQGYEGKYNKEFVSKCVKGGIKAFSLHDADGDGVDMDIILKHHSQSSAHWKDELAVDAYRMGFFPSIAKAVDSPPTPMDKTHIANLKTQVKRLAEIEDDLYINELEILLDESVRWELQSMGALDKTAGQAYIIEYLRNRNIPIKPMPNFKKVQRNMFEQYSKKSVLENLEETIDGEINNFADSIINKIKSILRASLKDKVEKAIEDLADFPDELPDNETIVKIFKEKLARNIESTSHSIEQWVVNDFCDIETSAKINGSVSKKENIITIKIDDMDIEASRTFNELKPHWKDEMNLYDLVISHCAINSSVCKAFREALETKFENFEPESDPDIEDLEYTPEEEFDTFEIDEYKYQAEKAIRCPTCDTITIGLPDSDNDIRCKDCDSYRKVNDYEVDLPEVEEEEIDETDETVDSVKVKVICDECETENEDEPDSDNQIKCENCSHWIDVVEKNIVRAEEPESDETDYKPLLVKIMTQFSESDTDIELDLEDDEWDTIDDMGIEFEEDED